MGNICLLTLLFIVTISNSFTTNKAHASHSLPYQTTQPPSPSPSPSHAPAPSPSHHHHHHHHHHNHRHAAHSPALAPSPSYASAPPPSQPSKPVTPSPPPPPPHAVARAPTHAVKRQLVAVQGMVYCKSNCSSAAASNNTTTTTTTTLFGASPLPGARVVLRCRNTPYLLRKTATTDKNGYFFMEAPTAVTTYGAHKCKVYLSHRPTNNNGAGDGVCSNATDLNNGVSGAYLFSNNTGPPKPLHAFSLFSVGPFAYVSATCA